MTAAANRRLECLSPTYADWSDSEAISPTATNVDQTRQYPAAGRKDRHALPPSIVAQNAQQIGSRQLRDATEAQRREAVVMVPSRTAVDDHFCVSPFDRSPRRSESTLASPRHSAEVGELYTISESGRPLLRRVARYTHSRESVCSTDEDSIEATAEWQHMLYHRSGENGGLGLRKWSRQLSSGVMNIGRDIKRKMSIFKRKDSGYESISPGAQADDEKSCLGRRALHRCSAHTGRRTLVPLSTHNSVSPGSSPRPVAREGPPGGTPWTGIVEDPIYQGTVYSTGRKRPRKLPRKSRSPYPRSESSSSDASRPLIFAHQGYTPIEELEISEPQLIHQHRMQRAGTELRRRQKGGKFDKRKIEERFELALCNNTTPEEQVLASAAVCEFLRLEQLEQARSRRRDEQEYAERRDGGVFRGRTIERRRELRSPSRERSGVWDPALAPYVHELRRASGYSSDRTL